MAKQIASISICRRQARDDHVTAMRLWNHLSRRSPVCFRFLRVRRKPVICDFALALSSQRGQSDAPRHACVSVYVVRIHSGGPGRVHDSVTACTARPCAHVRGHVRDTSCGEGGPDDGRRGEAWTAARGARVSPPIRGDTSEVRATRVRDCSAAAVTAPAD